MAARRPCVRRPARSSSFRARQAASSVARQETHTACCCNPTTNNAPACPGKSRRARARRPPLQRPVCVFGRARRYSAIDCDGPNAPSSTRLAAAHPVDRAHEKGKRHPCRFFDVQRCFRPLTGLPLGASKWGRLSKLDLNDRDLSSCLKQCTLASLAAAHRLAVVRPCSTPKWSQMRSQACDVMHIVLSITSIPHTVKHSLAPTRATLF